MKRILTSSSKQLEKKKQKVGLKVQQKERKIDVGSKQVGDRNFQLSLAAILKENRMSHVKLKSQRKSKRRLLDQSLKSKDTSRKMFVQTSKSLKALSSERFQRYCLTTLQTQCSSTKNDITYSADTKDTNFLRSYNRNINEISQMKDKILSNIYQNNLTKQTQIKKQTNIPKRDIDQIIKKQVIDIEKQIKTIENIIKQKIDPITDILNTVTILASKNKINFSHILFLTYKLFYMKRIKNTQILQKLYRQKGERIQAQHYRKQNDNIRQCMIEMLQKLKQGKKWKDVQSKWVYQKEDFEQFEVKFMHRCIMNRFISDYIKFAEIIEGNTQNNQIKIKFFITFCDLYEIQQDQNISFNLKQQYKSLRNSGTKTIIPQILIFLKEVQQTI